MNIFKKRKPKVDIEKGQTWEHYNSSGNPFEKYWTVEILDYQQGWVNYTFCGKSPIFTNESMKEGIFREIYRLKIILENA